MRGGMDARGLGELPAGCLAWILRSLSPREVGRLALVSNEFLDASRSDTVWERPRWRDVIVDLDGASRMRLVDVYARLCAEVSVPDDKNKIYWIDRPTGGICNIISARGLLISWGDDLRYWEWREMKGSRFDKVAVLKDVCWFAVRGEFSGHLRRGSYTVSFRLRYLDQPDEESEEEPENNNQAVLWIHPVWNDRRWRPRGTSYGWDASPVNFTLSTGEDHSKQESSRFLTAPHKLQDREIQAGIDNLASARPVEHGWMECDAGISSSRTRTVRFR